MGHAIAALVYLAGATILGLVLVFSPAGVWKLNLTIVYGVVGLLGFLSQIVVGMGARLLPMFAWMHAYAGSGFSSLPPSPRVMSRRPLEIVVLAIWQLGVPARAIGLYAVNSTMVRIAGWGMFVAVVIETDNSVVVLRHAFRRWSTSSGTGG
jgi:hypothetical protein